MVSEDDKLITKLLDKTEKLHNVTADIVGSWNNTKKNDTDEDFENVFLSDMCSSLAITVGEAMDVMHDKACRIEDYISQLPTLNVFDSLMIEFCGFYCKDLCSYGFPSLILTEYKLCLEVPERRNKTGNVGSNGYVLVSK